MVTSSCPTDLEYDKEGLLLLARNVFQRVADLLDAELPHRPLRFVRLERTKEFNIDTGVA
jgi:hypothetical protein